MKRISVSCPGSCGELFQCVVDDKEYLMSYNIDKRSYVSICEDSNAMGMACLGDKMQAALSRLGEVRGVRLEHYLEFPVGKGCSSSTADMLCALKALSLYKGLELSEEELTYLCAQVEPTDSVGFDRWTVIDPLSGQVIWETDWTPELYVYILEPIETVKTVGLVRMTHSQNYPSQDSADLMALFQEACQERSLIKIGQLANKSALLNNERLPKPYLDDIISLTQELGLLGVNVAHSGTVIGILFRAEDLPKLDELEKRLSSSCVGAYYQNRTFCQIIYEGVREKGGEEV